MLCLLAALFAGRNLQAQLSGNYSVPSGYATISAAIADLNLQGINGPVVINIAAGYTETAPAGGYTLTATGTLANPITFQKSGAGANPLITAFAGGSGTPGTAVQDGILQLVGSDYVTIDGIDLLDANTSNPATMEYGYGLFKASVTDGCQNVTIRNCVITLNRANNASGAGPAIDGSKGIEVVNAVPSAHTTQVFVTAASGSNSYNKFYSNTIQNCNVGISLSGFASASPYTNSDTGNDVGGASALTGNTIINYGGGQGALNPAAAVFTQAQYNVNVSYNLINNNNGQGIGHSGVLRGIYLGSALAASSAAGNNTLTISSGSTNQLVSVIENLSGGGAAGTATVNISNNLIANCTNSTTAIIYGIRNTGATPSVLNISGNTFTNNTRSSATGATYLINNDSPVPGLINMTNNNLSYTFSSATPYTGAIYNIHNTSASPLTTTLNISNNNFSNFSFPNAIGTGIIRFVYNDVENNSLAFNNNTFTNLNLNSSGSHQLLYNYSATHNTLSISNNSIVGTYVVTGSSGGFTGIYNYGPKLGTCTQTITGNSISNVTSTVAGSGGVNGIYISGFSVGSTLPYPLTIYYNNIVSNINYNGSGFSIPLWANYLGDGGSNMGSAVYSNTLSNFSISGFCFGAFTAGGGIGSPNYRANIHSNVIDNVSTTGSSMMGVSISPGGAGINFYNNKISNIYSYAAGASGVVSGIECYGNTDIYNNIIGNLYAPNGSNSGVNDVIRGLVLSGATNVYNNTIRLDGTSSATPFSSSALYASSASNLDLRNNILINLTVPTGTGVAVAYRRSTSAIATYSASSNNNLFYAGQPAANHLIFDDGITPHQQLSTYKAALFPIDAAAITENTPFTSTVSVNPGYLHVNPMLPSLTESGGANVAGITNDFDLDIRQGNPGYAGNGNAPDIGADEYGQNLAPCVGADAGTVTPVSLIKCAGEIVSLNSAGYTYTAAGGITHQWKVGSVPGGPYTAINSGSGFNTPAFTSGALTAGNYYYVLETTCAASVTAASNEVTVAVHPVPTASISALTPTLCAGKDLIMVGLSDIGNSFTWSGPNTFFSTTQYPILNSIGMNGSGIYSLTVASPFCTAPGVSVAVTVLNAPNALTVTPASAAFCGAASQTISVAGGITPLKLTIGTMAAQNAVSTYPAPYSARYAGQRMQTLILASELTAAGFIANTPLVDLEFSVVSFGAAWGTSVFDCQNFQINMMHTPLNTLTAFQSGLTNVLAPLNYTPALGYNGNNVHTFSTPFVWNGTDNIVLETTFSNNTANGTTAAILQYNSPANAGSTLVFRANSMTAAAVATSTTVNLTYASRPDMKLNGTTLVNFAWGPAQGLSATSGSFVTATPSVSTTYVVNTSFGTCVTDASVTIQVSQTPTLSLASTSSVVCIGNSASITASGASSYTWSNNATAQTIVVSPAQATTYTVTGANAPCPPATATLQLMVSPALSLTATSTPTALCVGNSATLNVSGASNYTWSTGSTAASTQVSPVVSTVYNVNATSGPGCSASKTVAVIANSLPVISVSPASQSVCAFEPVSYTASGASTYSWNTPNSGSAVLTVNAGASASYSVTGTDANGCSSISVANLEVMACVGITENRTSGDLIHIFPNPSSGIVTAAFDFEGKKEITVFNSTGAQVGWLLSEERSETFDLSGFNKGIYMIRINVSGSNSYFKVVIQ